MVIELARFRKIGGAHKFQCQWLSQTFPCSIDFDRKYNTRVEPQDFYVETKSVSQEYKQKVKTRKLIFDPFQRHIATKLTRLQASLKNYNHTLFLDQLKQREEYERMKLSTSPSNNKQLEVLVDNEKEKSTRSTTDDYFHKFTTISIPRGFYIYGDVGTGKTLLMNMFFATAPVASPDRKRRLHFHSLLQEIHQRIHILNKDLLLQYGRSFHVDTSKSRNPILQVAQQISDELTLLCVDEFQVTDVADAMILSQFFGELWRRGVVIVSTSNRPPCDLYEGGLNRSYFLPFIDLVEKYCLVHHLGKSIDNEGIPAIKTVDYRRIKSVVDEEDQNKSSGKFFYVSSEESYHLATLKLDQLFEAVQRKYPQNQKDNECFDSTHDPNTSECLEKQLSRPLKLHVKFQRTITISRYHSNVVARFTFDELCSVELGSSDYQAIATYFQIIMLENIPILSRQRMDLARRFITLLDELYDAGCCVACTAAEIPDNLFLTTSNHDEVEIDLINLIKSTSATVPNNELAVDSAQAEVEKVSESASVKELPYAIRRATSRLLEICSKSWWEEKGIILSY